MANPISFMSANYVARELDYHMTEGWQQGERATEERFRPLATFRERFAEVLRDIRGLGFEALDLWLAHLHPTWASDAHVEAAQAALAEHGLSVASLAGSFGADRVTFERSCSLARALGTDVLGGTTPLLARDRAFVLDALGRHGVRLGIENHPEPTAGELRAQIGEDVEGRIGATLDTGWFATQGYPPERAVIELRDVLVHVHLSDVVATGSHRTCRYGSGVVDVPACVAALRDVGYEGAITVEHEPDQGDPSADVAASARALRGWLA